jgi:ubiquinone/menaquinone biosynthesis C-methylase UbiE
MPEDHRWDLAYQSGEFKHWESDYPSPELAALVAAGVVPKRARILDVGSGGGKDAIFMAQCGFRVVGVDISAAALKIAGKRAEDAHVEVDWRRGSALDLPVEDCSVDLVTDRGLFHHLDEGERTRYAAELFRVLKVRGRALIRGANEVSAPDRFNPITEEAIRKHFPSSRFKKGPVLPMPLYSIVGAMESSIVMLQKSANSLRNQEDLGS